MHGTAGRGARLARPLGHGDRRSSRCGCAPGWVDGCLRCESHLALQLRDDHSSRLRMRTRKLGFSFESKQRTSEHQSSKHITAEEGSQELDDLAH